MVNFNIDFGGGGSSSDLYTKEFRDKLVFWKQATFPVNDSRFGSTFLEKKAKYEKQFNNGIIIPYGADNSKTFNQTQIENDLTKRQAGASSSRVGGFDFASWPWYYWFGGAGVLGLLFYIFKKRRK
jgi:LPXTG-motif cell wall-anchored protein